MRISFLYHRARFGSADPSRPRERSQASLSARRRAWLLALGLFGVGGATAALINMTLEDFHLSGTQVGDVSPDYIWTSENCDGCHGHYDEDHEPYGNWQGSLMGVAGRDPLFYAQLATANQDVGNVGYFCLRCHVPMSMLTGHANQALGDTLDEIDRDGVTCHFCHSLVDPIYKPGISPPEDVPVLATLAEVPAYYGNAMFVLDPNGLRRGPHTDAYPPHDVIFAPFQKTGEMCGTCHDVGNVAVTQQPDGTFRYNAIDQRVPDENLHTQFPLERTYTEWKLSAFANGGVDMGGRFNGTGPTVINTCQDCHMPKATARGCVFGPERDDLAVHDFSGAAAQVLDMVALHYQNDPYIDPAALARGRARAISMLERAASLELAQQGNDLRVRVINETGHKLPTGHIEGRRVWLNVKFFDANDVLVAENGHYDYDAAELEESTTRIYEMHVGLSDYAAQATGLPAGVTTHMALADTIMKDNRIPPRGFDNAAYAAAGAPVVAATYADGQYWDDVLFPLPPGTVRAEVTVNYQSLTRHYIEALRDGNQINEWGQTLYDLWVAIGKGAPIPMVSASCAVLPVAPGDLNCDGVVDFDDINPFVLALTDPAGYAAAFPACNILNGDLTGDGLVTFDDINPFVALLAGR